MDLQCSEITWFYESLQPPHKEAVLLSELHLSRQSSLTRLTFVAIILFNGNEVCSEPPLSQG